MANQFPPSSTASNTVTSPRKLASSRANGQKSTGPKTAAGLQRCTTAAARQITHGMLAKTILIQGESQARFLALLDRFISTHLPITEAEHNTIIRMTVAMWRQLRVWSFQTLDMNREIARQDPSDESAPAPFRASLAFRTLCLDAAHTQAVSHRYESTYERQYYRALKTFTDLKANRDPTVGLANTSPFDIGGTWEDSPAGESPVK